MHQGGHDLTRLQNGDLRRSIASAIDQEISQSAAHRDKAQQSTKDFSILSESTSLSSGTSGHSCDSSQDAASNARAMESSVNATSPRFSRYGASTPLLVGGDLSPPSLPLRQDIVGITPAADVFQNRMCFAERMWPTSFPRPIESLAPDPIARSVLRQKPSPSLVSNASLPPFPGDIRAKLEALDRQIATCSNLLTQVRQMRDDDQYCLARPAADRRFLDDEINVKQSSPVQNLEKAEHKPVELVAKTDFATRMTVALGDDDGIQITECAPPGVTEALRDLLCKTEQTDDDDFLQELRKTMSKRTYKKDAVLFHQGDHGSEVFVLAQGCLGVLEKNREVNWLTTGAVFGQRALVNDRIRTATIRVYSETATVWAMDAEKYQEISRIRLADLINLASMSQVGFSFFKKLNREDIEAVLSSATLISYKRGDAITNQGDPCKRFYIVASGDIEKEIDGKRAEIISKGAIFEEAAMLESSLHKASFKVASRTAEVWQIDKLVFITVTQKSVKAAIQNLRKSQGFDELSVGHYDCLMSSVYLEKYKRHDVVVRQGEYGSKFYVINSGNVCILIDGLHVKTLETGDFFGERALLLDEPRAASVVVESDVAEFWVVDRDNFLRNVNRGNPRDGVKWRGVRARLLREMQ